MATRNIRYRTIKKIKNKNFNKWIKSKGKSKIERRKKSDTRDKQDKDMSVILPRIFGAIGELPQMIQDNNGKSLLCYHR